MKRLLTSLLVLGGCVGARDGACPPGDSCAGTDDCLLSGGTCTETKESAGRPSGTFVANVVRTGFCGDGIWDPQSEQCDDGSACRDGRDCTNDRTRCQVTQVASATACQPRANDGCSDQCTVESGYVCLMGSACHPQSPCRDGRLPSSDGVCAASDESPAALPGITPIDSPDSAPSSGEPDPGDAPAPPDHPDPPFELQTPMLGLPVAPAAGAPPCPSWTFQPPELLTGFDPSYDLWAPAIASDGLTLVFVANQPGTPERIYFATRHGRDTAFSRPALFANIGSDSADGTPALSFDGLSLYFYSRRRGGTGDRDLWSSTRPARDAEFGAATHLEGLNTSGLDHLPWLTADELTILYVTTFASGSGQSDVWFAQRPSRDARFTAPQPFAAVSGNLGEGRAVLASDGTGVFFSANRAGGQGGQDLWFTGIEGQTALAAPVNLRALNSSAQDTDPYLSADEHELFFASRRNGRAELFRSLIECAD